MAKYGNVTMIPTADMSREEWLLARRKYIGGSDAAAVMGLSRWSSPMSVWLDKTGQAEPEEESEAMYWGVRMEEVVADEFQKQTGMKVQRKNAILVSNEYPWMSANIDRELVGQEVGLECKTANAFMRDEWAGDNLPDAYYCQCQHYMAVTGWQSWWIAALIGGNRFVYKLIPRNDEFITHLINEERRFYEMVQSDTAPAPDGSAACGAALKEWYPQATEPATLLPYDAADAIARYLAADEAEKSAKADKSKAQQELQQMLGLSERGQIDDYEVRWTNVKPRITIDSKKLREEMPQVYEQYAKTGNPSRRFSIGGIR